MKTTLRPLAIAIALINASSLMAADEPEVRELESVTISASRSDPVEEAADEAEAKPRKRAPRRKPSAGEALEPAN